jgi:hypothetical protein
MREKEIQTVKVKNNLSYPEARKLVLSRTPKAGVSYAAATSFKSVKDMSTQTDLTSKENSAITTNETGTNNNLNPKSHKKKKKTANSQTINAKPQDIPLPKRPKNKPTPITSPKQLTREDFLKNTQNTLKNNKEIEDSLKVYVSSEDDMQTDSAPGSDAEAPDPSFC